MDKNKNDFFVGYSDQIPQNSKKGIRRFVVVSALVLVVTAVLFSFTQRPFTNATFELTKETTLIGTFYQKPYPMLSIKDSLSTRSVMLLGFGKFGANKYIDHLLEKNQSLNGQQLEIKGNLIYYNNKTLLQITSQEKVQILGPSNVKFTPEFSPNTATLEGEIVDPKCYFGVMKPGFGKIHRSCAVRCISGGIPAVFVNADSLSPVPYYIITDSNGDALHAALANYIGKAAIIKGRTVKLDDWNYIQLDVNNIELTGKPSTIFE